MRLGQRLDSQLLNPPLFFLVADFSSPDPLVSSVNPFCPPFKVPFGSLLFFQFPACQSFFFLLAGVGNPKKSLSSIYCRFAFFFPFATFPRFSIELILSGCFGCDGFPLLCSQLSFRIFPRNCDAVCKPPCFQRPLATGTISHRIPLSSTY